MEHLPQEVTLSGSGMQEGGPLAQADPGQAAAQASAPGAAGAQGSGRELGGGPQPAAACPSQDRLAERKALLLQAVQR